MYTIYTRIRDWTHKMARRELLYAAVLLLVIAAGAGLYRPGSVQANAKYSFALPATVADSNCSRTSVGFTPLMDLGTGTYGGFQGGLYPNASNTPPADYLAVGQAQALKITPLSSAGKPDPTNGHIVLLSIGMSNAFMEYQVFQQHFITDPQVNPLVMVVNGAQPGSTADEIVNPNDPYWTYVQSQLSTAGVTSAQVQAIWLKEGIDYTTNPPATFPNDARNLQTDLAGIVQILETTFPNLQTVYLSSRTYGGYALIALNPEPYAYDSGFAVKWLIQDRINKVTQGSAWLGWGPYLWANGTTARSDGLQWLCTDFQADDGTHPSANGQQKVAQFLTTFFKTDPTTMGWYLKP